MSEKKFKKSGRNMHCDASEINPVISKVSEVLKENSEDILFSLISISLENSVDEIYWVNEDGDILYANESACRNLGYSSEEILSRKIEDLRPESSGRDILKQLKTLFKEKSGFSYETYHKRSDGTVYPVESCAKPVNFGSLKIACIYSRDISVNKSHEERIKRSEEEKTLILNSVHENLVYYDLDFKIIWANKEPAESVNLRPEELTGKTCYELWYNRASPCEDCTIKKAMTAKTPVTEEKTRKDGRCIKVSAYPVFDENKNLTGAVESVLDISRRKKAEKALEISEKQYRELFSTMSSGFVLHELITDSSGNPCDFRFLEINPAFEKMTGLDASVIKGRTFFEIFPYENKDILKIYAGVALSGEPAEFTDYNRLFDRYYNIYSYSPSVGRFASIFTDITDLINLRKDQKRSLEQIEKNFEQLAILNDEIRNPLQAIIGYVMLEEFSYTDKIIEQAAVIDKLVNRLDKRWLESEKIRDFLRKHYQFS